MPKWLAAIIFARGVALVNGGRVEEAVPHFTLAFLHSHRKGWKAKFAILDAAGNFRLPQEQADRLRDLIVKKYDTHWITNTQMYCTACWEGILDWQPGVRELHLPMCGERYVMK